MVFADSDLVGDSGVSSGLFELGIALPVEPLGLGAPLALVDSILEAGAVGPLGLEFVEDGPDVGSCLIGGRSAKILF